MLRWLLAACILAWMAGAAMAGPIDEGVAAYNRGDYATAYKLWRPLAERGDPVAQNNLGLLYMNGHGVPRDEAKALELVRKAAEVGYSIAQSNLGDFYEHGKGVEQNDTEAVIWYGLAGVQGNATALHELGIAFRNGKGVPRDNVQAAMWLTLAAAQGDVEAAEDRDKLAAQMSLQEVLQAKALAARWEPDPDGCKLFNLEAVPKWSQHVGLRGFFIMTPAGGGWCTKGRNLFGSDIRFGRAIKQGKRWDQQTKDQRAHTFAAHAGWVDVDGKIPQNVDELLVFVKSWAKNAFPEVTQLSKKARLYWDSRNKSDRNRFEVTNVNTELKDLKNSKCANYYSRIKETKNKLYKNKTLILEVLGYLCLNSRSKNELIRIELSERYLQGRRVFLPLIGEQSLETTLFFRGFGLLNGKQP